MKKFYITLLAVGMAIFCFVNLSDAISDAEEIQRIETLIQEYGKEAIIETIIKKRKGQITVLIDNELSESSGPPDPKTVNSQTILADLKKMGIFSGYLYSMVQNRYPTLKATIASKAMADNVTFGMRGFDVEVKLPSECKYETPSIYKPEGSRGIIHCYGMLLEFDDNRLAYVTYEKNYDFSIPISPYDNPYLNPHYGKNSKLYVGMSLDDFMKFTESWKSWLRKSGKKFQEQWLDSKTLTYAKTYVLIINASSKRKADWWFGFTHKKLTKIAPKDLRFTKYHFIWKGE